MPLFDLPKRANNDSEIIKKAQTKKAPKTTKVGSSIDAICALVNQKLGKYKDKYIIIDNKEDLEKYIDSIIDNGIAAIDTETTGLNIWRVTLVGICIYTYNQKPAYIPLNHESHITGIKYPNQCTFDQVKIQLDRCTNVKWIMHNSTFDIQIIMHNINTRLKCYWDTNLAANCLEENESHRLKDLHLKYCPDEGESESLKFSDLFKPEQYIKVPPQTAYLYAAGDAIKTLDLYDYQVKQFSDSDLAKVYDVFMNIEMPVVDVVVDMEYRGVEIDTAYAAKLHDEYTAQLDDAYKQAESCFNDYANKVIPYIQSHPDTKLSTPINISSPTQLAEFFYDVLQLESVDKKSPRGTGEPILEQFIQKNQCVDLCKAILEVRRLEKVIGTYIDKLPKTIESDGRVHGKFNQYGAKTGRFSSSDPNL